MAEKTINNPSLLPDDLPSLLDIQLSGNNIIAISGHPVAGSGGGTESDFVYYPVFDNTTGNVEFHLGTTASNPQPAGGWHISGADGARGPQGEPGNNGKTPTFQIDPENAHWEWKYTDDVDWTDTYVVASGAVGPKGDEGDDGISPTVSTSAIEGGSRVTFTYGEESSTYIDVMNGTPGVKGADGISPTVSTETIAGGNRVTFTYDTPSKTKYIDVMSGAPGAPGAEGFSPTISTTPITDDPEHPQGGTKVTVIDSTGSEYFNIWNGANGEGATVNLKDGDGIHITQSSNDYTIGVSANYSAMAVTWVQTQNYLKSVPNTYALKTDVEAASANALTEAKSWVNLQNFATETWVGQRGFITKDIDDLTYYYTTSETSSTSEIANALNTKLDSTVAAQTYQTKTDMTNYLTTSDASTTYQPKGNYASASDITDMATKTWVENKHYLTTVPDSYATKTYVETASANAYDKAVAQIPTDYITKNVNDLTYYYDKTDSDSRYMQKITDFTLSGDGTTNTPLGIDTTDIDDNKQYAFTTTGWEEVDDDYLSTAGGTVSGQLITSATRGTFDDSYLKCINDGNDGFARFGVGRYGGAVIKAVDGSNNPVQVNVRYNANNNELIQVQKSNADVGYLIPAKIEQAGWTPTADDKILHIVLESE